MLDPGRFTLRELVRMADARLQQEWQVASCLMAATFSAHSGKVVDPCKINPFRGLLKPPRPKVPADADPAACSGNAVGLFAAFGFSHIPEAARS